jgi:hypothetical protein
MTQMICVQCHVQARSLNLFVKSILVFKSLNLFFFFRCHHMSLMDFVASPPGCGRSVTDVLGWDAHEAHLRCPDEVDGDIWV